MAPPCLCTVYGVGHTHTHTHTHTGGICENQLPFAGGVMRTLNTGIVTVLNYGQRVPPAVSAITFAHEAGHNFGSNVSSTSIVETVGNWQIQIKTTEIILYGQHLYHVHICIYVSWVRFSSTVHVIDLYCR